ncbi:MAG: nucleotidyltransferase family protein [Proteobacteria bacterium]|nr:nucleotidyltransferase family protein [Pseudomonadota bacterium]MBU1058817.1 nucleotidyltransferase family protein [Pseudomonadota bacterium]
MPNLTLFEKQFFQFSRCHFNIEDGEKDQVFDDCDLVVLSTIAHQNGVAGFIYQNTKGLDIFSEQIQQELQAAYHHTIFRNLDQLAETIKILKLLSANQINAIPLKGVFASELIFHDLGVYPSGDIDILVHPDDLSLVKRILIDIGYTSVKGIQEEDLLANHYHLMFHDNRHLLEVHWNLTKRYFEVPADFWWHNVRTVRWRDMDVIELAPEKYILYTIFRLYDHCFYPLRFFVLISGIIDTYSKEIYWDTLLANSKKYKMRRLTLFTFKLLHELLGTQIPDHILQTKIMGYGALKKIILSGIFKGVIRQHLRMMLYTSLLDGPIDISKALLGRLFPKKGELCFRYNLPHGSSKIWLYYAINPIMLFFKKR